MLSRNAPAFAGFVFFAAVAIAAPSNPAYGGDDDSRPCQGAPQTLDPARWHSYPINQISVLDGTAAKKPDDLPKTLDELRAARICAFNPKDGPCVGGVVPDLLMNGTFYSWDDDAKRLILMGQTMRQGRLSSTLGTDSVVYRRAGFAVLTTGETVVCNPGASNHALDQATINQYCSSAAGATPWDYMGGGALLIYQGKKACATDLQSGKPTVDGPCDASIDLTKAQKFWYSQYAGQPPLTVGPFRADNHTVVALRQGKAYILWPKVYLTGQELQDQLCAAGFDNVIKFDGGGGFSVLGEINGENLTAGVATTSDGAAPSGLLIKVD